MVATRNAFWRLSLARKLFIEALPRSERGPFEVAFIRAKLTLDDVLDQAGAQLVISATHQNGRAARVTVSALKDERN